MHIFLMTIRPSGPCGDSGDLSPPQLYNGEFQSLPSYIMNYRLIRQAIRNNEICMNPHKYSALLLTFHFSLSTLRGNFLTLEILWSLLNFADTLSSHIPINGQITLIIYNLDSQDCSTFTVANPFLITKCLVWCFQPI